jgi:hypothetical protein
MQHTTTPEYTRAYSPRSHTDTEVFLSAHNPLTQLLTPSLLSLTGQEQASHKVQEGRKEEGRRPLPKERMVQAHCSLHLRREELR